ncbi:ATP-binding protein [Tahibacter amnicola]|uniref:histidine kinase n=1 Tax=Tahibacter amnicola TaxID=2976241 RepID=A0ABY6BPF7_9GAMM|nr:ATP-binding protein [Tahibacter amnicola]UXI70436.1 ATP-binding protein [Tahibacter amnicola]
MAVTSDQTTVWVGQREETVQVWRWRDGQWSAVDGPPGHSQGRIDAMHADASGRVWVRQPASLWQLDPGQSAFVVAMTPVPIRSGRGFLIGGRHDDLWVPSDEVLLHYVADQWHVVDVAKSLATPWSRAVLEDHEGSLWLGNVGLHRLLRRGLFQAYTTAEGLRDDVIWTLLRDRRGHLWVGTGKGLARMDADRITQIPGTFDLAVRNIVEGEDGLLYLAGSPGDRLLTVDPERLTVRSIPLPPHLHVSRIFRLLFEARDSAWLATDERGLLRVTLGDSPQFQQASLPAGTTDEFVGDVRRDSSGRLWTAGRHGIAVRGTDNQWRRYTDADGLRRTFVQLLRPLSDGDVLVSYFDPLGVARVRLDGERLQVKRHYDVGASGSPGKAFLLGEDSENRLWIGGARGIDVVTDTQVQHYGVIDGLVGEDTNNMAFLAEAGGDIWIGTSAGLARFNDRRAGTQTDPQPPTPLLLDATAGGQRLDVGIQNVHVPPDADVFEARVTALTFVAEGNVQYRMQLVGMERQPNITANREVRYAGLPAGRFRFEVAARIGPNGDWSPPATFSFERLPAWWETTAFRLLVGVAIVLVALGLVRWRTLALQWRNRALAEQVAARTSELRQANTALRGEIDERVAAQQALSERNQQLQALNETLASRHSQLIQSEKLASVGQLAAGVAHEINNPIGFVRSNLGTLRDYYVTLLTLADRYRDLESHLPEGHPAAAELARLRAAVDIDYLRSDGEALLDETQDGVNRVQKIVRDLRDFSQIDSTAWQWADLHAGLDSTLNVLSHAIRGKVDVIKCYAEIPPVRCVLADINQVFLNVLVNALQAMDGHGVLTISTGITDGQAWVAIRDNGAGIRPDHLPHVFEPFFTTRPVGSGTGLGLAVAYNVIRRHGGSIDIESAVGAGTTVTVRMPVQGPLDAEPAFNGQHGVKASME